MINSRLSRVARVSTGIILTGVFLNACSEIKDESATEDTSFLTEIAPVTATASSVNGTNTAAKAIDGSTTTRWESVQGVDPQWITLDLGSSQSIGEIKLTWEGA